MNLRTILWGVAGVSVFWNFIDFIHDLIVAADPDSYQTAYSAISMFITGNIRSFQWIFYAEVYHLLKTHLSQKSVS